jgi:hypothetical protein
VSRDPECEERRPTVAVSAITTCQLPMASAPSNRLRPKGRSCYDIDVVRRPRIRFLTASFGDCVRYLAGSTSTSLRQPSRGEARK